MKVRFVKEFVGHKQGTIKMMGFVTANELIKRGIVVDASFDKTLKLDPIKDKSHQATKKKK